MDLQHEIITQQEEEKMELLKVQELSEVERRYTLTALTIFKERYLLKDNQGNTVERLDQLFKRVAVSAGLMEVLYDETVYDKEGKQRKDKERIKQLKTHLKIIERQNSKLDYADIYDVNTRFALWDDGFVINNYHIESLLRRYIELASEGRMKTDYFDILSSLNKNLKTKCFPLIKKYYDLMANAVFLPNTPALMNAGTKLGQNAACFTLEIHDDLEHIYQTYADIAKIFKSGGGIGINYSELRPEGAYVNGTGGKSSGTLSWLKGTDETTGRVAQGGKRRGASMGILNIDHPEIEKFIDLKDNKTLENHNISVCTPDSFFAKLLDNDSENKHLMNKITKNAWKTGDPGMVFLDNMNSNNRLIDVIGEPIQVTNPCSEISMYPYESCILASINLNKFIDEERGRFDLMEFIDVTRTVTKFLDNIIDATKYPLGKINKMTKSCRRIGVGYMGLADVLARLEIPYNSKNGFIFTEFITAVMSMVSLVESNRMAKYKGAFPFWYNEHYHKWDLPVNGLYRSRYTELGKNIKSISNKFYYEFIEEDDDLISIIKDCHQIIKENDYILRNCSVTTVAPTGTLSMFADCSMGIEPLFALEYTKKVTLGSFKYLDKNYEKAIKSGMNPEKLSKIFVTAMDIHPFDHIMMQSVAQQWITNGISKTINAPNNIDEKLIEHCYVLAWAMGNKGTTVYRDRCKDVQVLNDSNSDSKKIEDMQLSEYTKEKIMSLYNIPDSYIKEILTTPNKEEGVEKYIYHFAGVQKTVIMDRKDMTSSIYCHGCGATNTIHKNGNTCFICISCGTSIGSCS